jgi:hypothetical protein
MHVEAERPELLGDERARGLFLEGGLRMSVEVMPPALDFRDQGGDFGNDVHGDSGKGQSRKQAS